jgi:Kef-type K+ transport system membrane component KefB
LFGWSVLLGWLAAKLLTRISEALSNRQQQYRALILAMIMLLLGIGHWLGVSSLLALLVLGLASRVGQGKLLVNDTDLAPLDSLLCVVLFVYSGAQLTFEFLHQYIWLALLFILLRSGVAVSVTGLMTWLNGISLKKGLWLGLSLYPMSGIATVLVMHTATHYPAYGQHLSALMASVLVILELSGPLVLRSVLKASGEAHN